MPEASAAVTLPSSAAVFSEAADDAIPIHLVRSGSDLARIEQLSSAQRAWALANDFSGRACQSLLLPGEDGSVAACLFGIGSGDSGVPCGAGEWLLGDLVAKLPAGTYAVSGASAPAALEAAAISWGLGAYAFRRYRKASSAGGQERARLVLPSGTDHARIRASVDAIWLGRDMINTPANDLGPAEIEAYVRALAKREDASCEVIVGDDLLSRNFPLIHAVGRASPRAPRLIDLRWGRADAPTITLVGKGICFDTGGLDLKPASAMLLMKKDMGGAASALALASMIMATGLDVRLRLLIAAAENSVAGDAFRPGDVIKSRAGLTVEIGNTDAEGRLVLADALSLAAEEKPRLLASFATLTGAARVALGADLPAMFSTADKAAESITASGLEVADPVWRLPFWPGYEKNLDSAVADMNNVSDGPFAGAVTAALFLKRFAAGADTYVHFDLFGWRQAKRPLGPKGGEPHVARALLEYIQSLAKT